MKVMYNSTRNINKKVTSSYAIVKGLSDDGGLFVPSNLEDIKFDYNEFIGKSYNDIAKKILSVFFSDFTKEQIDYCVNNAYNPENFSVENIFSVKTLNKDLSILELFTGNTIAFKDAALSILPHLMKCARENEGLKEKITILTATSGDTGKAALEGFHNKEGVDVIVFYPYKGVSKLQLLQMLTQKGSNVLSVAVKGNFDDTQNGVKEIFNDNEFKEALCEYNQKLSSANSINIGRLVPQIIYYYYTYVNLIENGKINKGEKIDVVVPTGNFGNILAGYYAKKSGLPIDKLLCASNDNNVLFDFFKTGIYDKNRDFKKTIAPSMDILISSNLERLVYHTYKNDDKKVNESMNDLKINGKYKLKKEDMDNIKDFIGGYATEAEIIKSIKEAYERENYLMDTHTACGYKVYLDNKKSENHTVILSTASPYKFSKDVYLSLFDGKDEYKDDIEYMYALNKKTGVLLPKVVEGIENFERREEIVIEKEEMKDIVKSYIKERANV